MLTQEEIEAIRKRAEKAKAGNPMTDMNVLYRLYESAEDIPKLLAEIDRLRNGMSEVLAELDFCMAYKHPVDPQHMSAELYQLIFGGDE